MKHKNGDLFYFIGAITGVLLRMILIIVVYNFAGIIPVVGFVLITDINDVMSEWNKRDRV